MSARPLVPLALAGLLAGCTLGEPPAPAEPPVFASPCGALELNVEPGSVLLGAGLATLRATFTNCGADPLPLRGSGRCGRGHPIAITVESDRSYEMDEARPADAVAAGDLAHHGSCGPASFDEPFTVPPGGNVTRVLQWNGSRSLLLTWRSPFAAGDGLPGTSITAALSPEPVVPGAYRVAARVATDAGDASWERSEDVRLVGEAPEGPEHRAAYTRWRPQPDGTRPPRDLPAEPGPAAVYVANGSLVSRLGQAFFERNARLLGVEPDGRNGTCDPPACDRWLVTYELRLGESGATFGPIAVPVAAGAVVDAVPIGGVPDCREDRAECEFPITRDIALHVARQHGTDDPADAEMAWHAVGAAEGTLGTYAWRVSPSGMLLDANDATRLDA